MLMLTFYLKFTQFATILQTKYKQEMTGSKTTDVHAADFSKTVCLGAK